jgi:hypothetical protein
MHACDPHAVLDISALFAVSAEGSLSASLLMNGYLGNDDTDVG